MIFNVKDGLYHYHHNEEKVNIETIEDLDRLSEKYDYGGWSRAVIVDFDAHEIIIYNDYVE